ncbi:hypothetical protein MAP00_008038 [Monascus purpureus]|nr:hypothetical protein MAP00_008038 [Monascus purpureus]
MTWTVSTLYPIYKQKRRNLRHNDHCLASRLFFNASCTWFNHHKWILESPVNSGWKLVPNILPCPNCKMPPASLSALIFTPSLTNLTALSGSVASTSTWDPKMVSSL